MRIVSMKKLFLITVALNIVHFVVSFNFLLSTAWGALLAPEIASDGFIEFFQAFRAFAPGLGLIFFGSTICMLLEIWLWNYLKLCSIWLFSLSFLAAVLTSYVLQILLRQEYLSGYAFRYPSDSLGYLNVTSVYGSSALIAHMSFMLQIGAFIFLRAVGGIFRSGNGV